MNFTYADESKNLLHLIWTGTLNSESAQRFLDNAEAASRKLRQNFDVLSDLRDLKAIEQDATERIDEMMERLTQRGVQRVIRVLPSETENFGLAIMSMFHYGKNVQIITCRTLEEACKFLSDKQ